MKIDWKQLAKSDGYKSLKQAYIKSVTTMHRHTRKEELYRDFQKVISKAVHYAYHTGKSVEQILNQWEQERTYCWRNFYQDIRQKKFHSNYLKPLGIKGYRKHLKKWHANSKQLVKHNVMREINRINRNNSTKTKPRWTTERKLRGY